MKTIRTWILAAAALTLVGAGSAFADQSDSGKFADKSDSGKKDKPVKAPEIDAVSGTSALALLAGGVVLVRERSRATSKK